MRAELRRYCPCMWSSYTQLELQIEHAQAVDEKVELRAGRDGCTEEVAALVAPKHPTQP